MLPTGAAIARGSAPSAASVPAPDRAETRRRRERKWLGLLMSPPGTKAWAPSLAQFAAPGGGLVYAWPRETGPCEKLQFEAPGGCHYRRERRGLRRAAAARAACRAGLGKPP